MGRDGGEDESLKFITSRETINCLTMGRTTAGFNEILFNFDACCTQAVKFVLTCIDYNMQALVNVIFYTSSLYMYRVVRRIRIAKIVHLAKWPLPLPPTIYG